MIFNFIHKWSALKQMSDASQATFKKLQVPTTFHKKLFKIQSTVYTCLVFKNHSDGEQGYNKNFCIF
jgi:hypothetical protein